MENSAGYAFVPAVVPPEERSGGEAWFAFVGSELLVREEGGVAAVPCAADLAPLQLGPERRHYLGRLGGLDCFAVELDPGHALPEGTALCGLRGLYGRLDDAFFSIAGRAAQIVEWDRTHRYCGRCGAPTERLRAERARECPRCRALSFPRLSPAVIVLVERGAEILLARGHRFPEPFYSVLAGFVEPGESLEQAVVREVREEVGVEIEGIRYFGSQPWPFPHSLMIGFTSTYAGGEIVIDETELADAAWFPKSDLPRIPPKLSIARSLIDWACERP